MRFALSRTTPFRKLQKNIGSSTYRLNTIVVGLQYVADGGDIKEGLPVTWRKPPRGKEQQVADQARIFACTSATILAFDVFDQYIRQIANESWLEFKKETVDIATKSVRRNSSGGGDYSIAERTEVILDDLNEKYDVLLSGVELFSKWRNAIVHSSTRRSCLEERFEKCLINNEAHIKKRYSHLDVCLAINNYKSGKHPVLKEVTSFMSMIQNISRIIDESSIKRRAGTEQKIIAVSDTLLSNYFNDPERNVSAWSEIAEAWKGPSERKEKNLRKVLEKIGFTETSKPVSAPLPEAYVEQLVATDAQGIASRFDVYKK